MNIRYTGRIVQQKRKHLGIDQRELSRIAGVSIHALSNIESGTGNPTMATLIKVLDALGLELKVQVRDLQAAQGNQP